MELLSTYNLIAAREMQLDRIARYLLINGALTDDISLFHGKTGMAFFLLHYAAHRQSDRYRQFAEEILQDVTGAIDSYPQPDYAKGVTGIAWGLEHLLARNLITTETVTGPLLSSLDERIYGWHHCLSRSYPEELTAHLHYVQARIARAGYDKKDMEKLVRHEVYINLTDKSERRFQQQYGGDATLLLSLARTPQHRLAAKYHEVTDYAGNIIVLSKNLSYNLYPAVTMRLLSDMMQQLLPAAEYLLQHIPPAAPEAFLYFSMLVELLHACYTAGKNSGNEEWRIFALEKMFLAIDGYMPAVDTGFRHSAHIGKTMNMAQIFRRFHLEYKDHALENMYHRTTDHLVDQSYLMTANSHNKHLGLREGLAGIGLVLLSGIRGDLCYWDESILIS
ncbi:lanthionine synthetase LanC family protein [Chitinophaga solisilvae]|uniref:lanthionine synthetase LanC family protein n=1 Tax=Chitinophaga solisilvae TaxID=1233460 RepID=UPI001369B46E|nr:lanthionine synthetase LanC family protein [Chitinophaga solisilvae]